MKLRLAVPLRRARRKRRPPEQAPRTIVPQDRFDAARERLKRQIPPRED